MAKVYIEIRRNSDGEVRMYTDKTEFLENGYEFNWHEGNYSCDCNRAAFFAKAGGEEDPDSECGDGSYSVRVTQLDGTLVYQDF